MLDQLIILTGDNIQLESLQENHRQALKEIALDEKISTYSPSLRLNFDSWFNKALKNLPNYNQLSFIVRTLTNQRIIGTTRFYDISLDNKHLTIGYTWYTPLVWGTVVNPECKFLLLDYAFHTLLMNRVSFNIDSRNKRSIAAVKKLGALEEGLLRQHIILEDGYIRDTCVFSIIKSEWPTIKTNLQERIRLF